MQAPRYLQMHSNRILIIIAVGLIQILIEMGLSAFNSIPIFEFPYLFVILHLVVLPLTATTTSADDVDESSTREFSTFALIQHFSSQDDVLESIGTIRVQI